MIATTFINIWNKRVGTIAWNVDKELASFEFESSFLTNKWDLSPLKMPIGDAQKGIFFS